MIPFKMQLRNHVYMLANLFHSCLYCRTRPALKSTARSLRCLLKPTTWTATLTYEAITRTRRLSSPHCTASRPQAAALVVPAPTPPGRPLAQQRQPPPSIGPAVLPQLVVVALRPPSTPSDNRQQRHHRNHHPIRFTPTACIGNHRTS